jgi:predicted amidohydrolase
MRLASTQVSLKPVTSQAEYWDSLESFIQEARNSACDAVLLPEYACLSLLGINQAKTRSFLKRLEDFSHHGYQDYERQILRLSQAYAIAIIGGTYPVTIEPGHTVNRCIIARPKQDVIWQDKLHMTRFEKEQWQIQSPRNPTLHVFDLQGVRTAVTICYDVEFSALAREAAKARVELMLVPSCTDHAHGYWRVRHCAHARTIENQCFVAIASVVDGDPQFDEMDTHYGQAGIFSPCDSSFPVRGVVAEGELNRPGWIAAELDVTELNNVRQHGSVLNLMDQVSCSESNRYQIAVHDDQHGPMST